MSSTATIIERFETYQTESAAQWDYCPAATVADRCADPLDAGFRFPFSYSPFAARHPWRVSFLVLVAGPLLVFFIVAGLTDTLTIAGGTGLRNDWVLLNVLLSLWLAVGLTRRVLDMSCDVFCNVQSTFDKTKISRKQYEKAIEELWTIVDGRKGIYGKVKYGLMSAGFALWGWYAITQATYFGYDQAQSVWRFGDHPIGFAAVTAFQLWTLPFIWPVFIYKVLSLIYGMNRFFRQLDPQPDPRQRLRRPRLRLRPMSPDGAGGLGEMGKLALNMEYVFLPFIGVSVISYFRYGLQAQTYLLFPALAMVLVFVFWAPLMAAHSTMRRSKDWTLNLVEAEFNMYYDFLVRELEKDGPSIYGEEAAKSIENIENLQHIYAETKKMPVWPFDMAMVRRFTATIVIPIAVVLVPELFSRL